MTSQPRGTGPAWGAQWRDPTMAALAPAALGERAAEVDRRFREAIEPTSDGGIIRGRRRRHLGRAQASRP